MNTKIKVSYEFDTLEELVEFFKKTEELKPKMELVDKEKFFSNSVGKKRKHFTQWEEENLIAMWNQGKTVAFIAHALQRTPRQINAKVFSMRRAGFKLQERKHLPKNI